MLLLPTGSLVLFILFIYSFIYLCIYSFIYLLIFYFLFIYLFFFWGGSVFGRTVRARDILACCDASLLIPVRSARALQIVGTFSRGSCLSNVQREVSTPERGDAPSEQPNPPTGDAAAVRRLNAPRPPRDGLPRPLDGTTAGRREIVVYSGTCDATWDLSTGSEDLRASENSAHVGHFCEVHVCSRCWPSFMRKGQKKTCCVQLKYITKDTKNSTNLALSHQAACELMGRHLEAS